MKRPGVMMLLVAALVLGQANAHSPKAKVASLIEPPLKDVSSDKKFFGPPFPADYPDDKRPAVQKAILDKLKGPDQPYPALQSKADFDRDYVKDENSDKGSWKAQFEYDALRKKLAQEQADERAAQNRADKEGADVNDAQSKADAAAKDAADAQKGVDDAKSGGGTGDNEGELLPPSEANLEKLKKQVAEAEANYEKEKKEFEECKRQLEEAEANIKELKAKAEEMEKQLASETKLWVESKTMKLNLKKAREGAAHAKLDAAEARLKVAQNTKADVDAVLAKQKAESDAAHKNLLKEQGELAQAKKDLEKATVRLQKLRGYTPAGPKSASRTQAAVSFLALVAMQALM